MMTKHVIRESWAALNHNRQRSLFTVFSLAWGVACFVILMSYGNGFERALTKAFTAVGQDLVVMFGGQTSTQAGGLRAGRRVRMEYNDAVVLKETMPLVKALSPETYFGSVKAQRGGKEKEIGIRGVWPEYEIVRNMKLTDGRWINLDDVQRMNRVAVIGDAVAKDLFQGYPPIGEEIVVRGIRLTIIGVLQSKLQIANYNRRDNDCIFIPYDTFSLFGDKQYPTFIVWTAVTPDARDRAVKMVRSKMAELHRYAPTDEKAVEILPFGQFMSIVTGMSLAVKALLGFVGALTLIIGGVGLANIMLASVIDRTREIGMVKALGGRRSMVLWQFLIEASMIVISGGVLGTLLGVLVTTVIGSMPFLGPAFKDTTKTGDIHLVVSGEAILVSTVVLLIVGLIAGMAPALKASRLNPIEALRYE